MTVLRTLMFCAAWLAPAAAHAYIGPGAGISAIGSLLALIAVVLLAIVGFVWYPLKRLMKNRRKARTEAAEKDEAASS
jgi:cellobiose-specific phosphotransferase system component IIC